jgi:hypothetical protein
MIDDASDKELAYHYLFGWTMNYQSFVSGIKSKIFRRCRFDIYEDPELTKQPLLIKNNQFIFNSDIFDERDFTSLEDYKKIGMYDKGVNNINTVIKYINIEMSYTHQRDKKFRIFSNIKEILMSEFSDVISVKSSSSPKVNKSSAAVCGGETEEIPEPTGITDNQYPDIIHTCWVESLKNDIPIGMFLSDNRNIVIKKDGKYMGFSRNFIVRQFRTNKVFNTTRILDTPVDFIDFDRLDNASFKYFELLDTGFTGSKFTGSIHSIVPYTVKILKKHLKI